MRALRLARTALAACVLSLSALACAGETLLDEARSLTAEGRYDAALSRVERLLAESPEDVSGRFLRGVLLVETGRSDEAIVVFKTLVADHPELPEPYNNLAVLYAARGDYAAARDALLSAINTHPSYAIAHENLGDIYAKLAGIAYDQALSLDSGNAAARSKLALVHELFSVSPAPNAAEPPVQTVAAPVTANESDATLAMTPELEGLTTPVPAVGAATVASETEAPLTGSLQAVAASVRRWADAWSAQDVDAYLAHYGGAFQPPDGVSRAAWEAHRALRLRNPGFIEVLIEDLQVELHGADSASAAFEQSYRSDTYADRVHKVLGLAREDGVWLIVSEVGE